MSTVGSRLHNLFKFIGNPLKSSLEHTDASLESTKHIPNQYVDEADEIIGSECQSVDDALTEAVRKEEKDIDPLGLFKK